ncbi:MAG: endonuclease/exonuclease/phosphatase family protein [Clostridia bacterium]|nr:endonuclease/exonuclease/phosphatase family protein [Clostridia bacterium]
MKTNDRSIEIKILRTVLCVLLAIVLIVGGYFAYVLIAYHRIDDNTDLAVEHGGSGVVPTGEDLTAMTYNIGFAAYTADYGFFLDGGNESRAASADSVNSVMGSIAELAYGYDPDLVIFEEVDYDSTRSYHIDEREPLLSKFAGYDSVFAINYDSPYLFYPILCPHGASRAGILTFTRYDIKSSVRRSLPIENTLMKLLDLDRCYSVTRLDTDNGRELVIYSTHMSAYSSDGSIATEQLKMLTEDMQKEYEAGNYVICGADFNKDVLGDSSVYFGIDGKEFTWAQPFPTDLLDGKPLTLVRPLDENDPIPSCRNPDGPYNENQFVLTIDSFIVSDNVTVTSAEVVDTGFAYSDHNPVVITFTLNK